MVTNSRLQCVVGQTDYSASLLQEVLLWSDHRTWSTDPDPGNGLSGCEAVMFHQVTANQRPRPAQTS